MGGEAPKRLSKGGTMTFSRVTNLTPDDFKRHIENRREKDYLLIDVRQPHEYAEGHLPGSQLMPLMEFEANIYHLPQDRELIFYCHSGSRSKMAALLAEEAEVTEGAIIHLDGGMLAWEGGIASGMPKVEIFEGTLDDHAFMGRAMDLEKGAYRFYKGLIERYPDSTFTPVIADLVNAEEAHARLVYGFWRRNVPEAPPFKVVFEQMTGEIIEGGSRLEDALDRIGKVAVRQCLTVLEFSLDIEVAAYDLYRRLAETVSESSARDTFFAIAQAEKRHMMQLAAAVEDCGERA
jgi:rhodanese-related sulfurtransferase/rubrerythrin